MIDGETGERTIHTLVKTQDEVRGNTGSGPTYYSRVCWGNLYLMVSHHASDLQLRILR